MTSKRRLLLIAVILLMFSVTAISPFVVVEVRNWMKLREYPEYVAWKKNGGAFRLAYLEPLGLDGKRDRLVAGLSYEQVNNKFPGLTDGTQYPPNSYKGEYLKHLRDRSPDARLLWLRPEDDFDYCVQIEQGEATLVLVKG